MNPAANPGSRKKLATYLKPILYNHKDIIIRTRKLTKAQEEEIFRKEQEDAEREEEELNRQAKKMYGKGSKVDRDEETVGNRREHMFTDRSECEYMFTQFKFFG